MQKLPKRGEFPSAVEERRLKHLTGGELNLTYFMNLTPEVVMMNVNWLFAASKQVVSVVGPDVFSSLMSV